MKKSDPQTSGAETDFSAKMSYSDYLGLDKVLDAQNPLSNTHDELLFIIQHQTSELWMKLALHELNSARHAISEDQYRPAFKMLARVSKIFVAQSSGFQSYQYRLIEYTIGNRNTAMLKPHAHRPDITTLLQDELQRPSLYDAVVSALERSGFDCDAGVERDLSSPRIFSEKVQTAWKTIYESPEQYWTLYELAEKLVDFEDYFRRWRFNHVTAVERVIGFKRGTGGTGGVTYLKKMLEVELFPELWRVRTVL